MRVDEDIVDTWVLQERFDWAEPGHFIENLFREYLEFLLIERNVLVAHIIADIARDLSKKFFVGHPIDQRKIEFVDDLSMKLYFGVQQRARLPRVVTDGLRGRAFLNCRRGYLDLLRGGFASYRQHEAIGHFGTPFQRVA